MQFLVSSLRAPVSPSCGVLRACVACVSCLQVIGRVAGLTLLNGAAVNPRERRDCELRYLQSVLAEQAEAAAAAAAAGDKQQQQQQAEQPPRLAELKAKYGQVRWGAVMQP